VDWCEVEQFSAEAGGEGDVEAVERHVEEEVFTNNVESTYQLLDAPSHT
jgi:hypothetical protein